MTRASPFRRRPAWIAASLVAFVVASGLFLFGFGDSLLNGYVKRKIERAFGESNPGSTLQIGELDYQREANRLVADSVTVLWAGTRLKAGPVSVTGVRWAILLQGKDSVSELLASATVDAANLSVTFSKAQYAIACKQLRANVPGASLAAHRVSLRPLLPDEEFFARTGVRSTRFQLEVPALTLLGVAYPDALAGRSFRATSVHLSRPSLDAFVNREKPVRPASMKRRLMVQEAFAEIASPFQIDKLSISNGFISYRERVVAGGKPGVLTFGSVDFSARGISNRAGPLAVISVDATGNLMNAGSLRIQMSIPLQPRDFSLNYSGSLGPMDLTRLNGFLEIPEKTRITSGQARKASFAIQVDKGHARGWMRGTYEDLRIAVLDKRTGTEREVASFVANSFKVRNGNGIGNSEAKVGLVSYSREPEDGFLKFIWAALRTGVLDVISH